MPHDPAYDQYKREFERLRSLMPEQFPPGFYPTSVEDVSMEQLRGVWLSVPLQFLRTLQEPFLWQAFLRLETDVDQADRWRSLIAEGVEQIQVYRSLPVGSTDVLKEAIGLGPRAKRTDTKAVVYRRHRAKSVQVLFKRLLNMASKTVVMHAQAHPSAQLSSEQVSILICANLMCGPFGRWEWDHENTNLTAWDRCRLVLLAVDYLKRVSRVAVCRLRRKK